jgi:mRNA-degrading endonuclease RelE of RelBE toxin-antitoxin system
MKWQVFLTKYAAKQLEKLPEGVVIEIRTLVHELEQSGPMRYNWKNFGKLRGHENLYHCHVKTGKPTYVVCWEVTDKKVKIVEVYYVGTHEKAPY